MYRIFILGFIFYSPFYALAQQTVPPRPSPAAIVSLKYKDTYVKITYSQPQRRGREVFGKLVPYNQVWRTGANEATEITITKDVYIKNILLPAGTYSIFSIPYPETWTIIINKETGLWGSYNYNQKLDMFRFEVPVQSTGGTVYESFTMQFEQRNNVADLFLRWENTQIAIPFQFIEPKP